MINRAAAWRTFWKRLSPRERMIGALCAGILGAAAIGTGIISPTLAYLDGLQTQIETRKIKLAKNRRWLRAGAGASVQPDLPALTSGTVNEDMSRFLKEIEQMAQASGTRIVALKPLPVEQKGIQEKLGVDLQLETGVASLVRYLHKIQTSPHLFEVNRFQLSAGDGLALRASLLITQTLFLPEPVRSQPRRR